MPYIEMGGVYTIKDQKYFGRKLYVEQSEIPNIRKRFNNTDVYATMFCYDDVDQNQSNLYGPMYLDLDLNIETEADYLVLKGDLARIVTYLNQHYGISKSQIKFYFTGKKGYHLIIAPEVFGVMPDNNLNTYYKEIAKELNKATLTELIDTKIYDKKRLLRLPNSINSKTGLYKVPITYEQITAFSFKQIKEYASAPKPVIKAEATESIKAVNALAAIKDRITKPKTKQSFIPKEVVEIENISLPSCIDYILKNGAAEGNRNNTTIILASAFFQQGVSYDDTLELINTWNERTNDPCLPEREIEVTVKSAYQQVQDGKRYGCTSIKEFDLCIGKECRIFK